MTIYASHPLFSCRTERVVKNDCYDRAPLIRGLSTHHVFYDFPSLHVSSPLLFCRLLALCQYQSDRVHILHWHSTAITYYTIGVIKGG